MAIDVDVTPSDPSVSVDEDVVAAAPIQLELAVNNINWPSLRSQWQTDFVEQANGQRGLALLSRTDVINAPGLSTYQMDDIMPNPVFRSSKLRTQSAHAALLEQFLSCRPRELSFMVQDKGWEPDITSRGSKETMNRLRCQFIASHMSVSDSLESRELVSLLSMPFDVGIGAAAALSLWHPNWTKMGIDPTTCLSLSNPQAHPDFALTWTCAGTLLDVQPASQGTASVIYTLFGSTVWLVWPSTEANRARYLESLQTNAFKAVSTLDLMNGPHKLEGLHAARTACGSALLLPPGAFFASLTSENAAHLLLEYVDLKDWRSALVGMKWEVAAAQAHRKLDKHVLWKRTLARRVHVSVELWTRLANTLESERKQIGKELEGLKRRIATVEKRFTKED